MTTFQNLSVTRTDVPDVNFTHDTTIPDAYRPDRAYMIGKKLCLYILIFTYNFFLKTAIGVILTKRISVLAAYSLFSRQFLCSGNGLATDHPSKNQFLFNKGKRSFYGYI